MSSRRIATVLPALALALLFMAALPALTDAAERGSPGLIDINVATPSELEELPGIGPSLARKIVEFRESNGPFRTVDDLLKIRGIGEKSLERFRDRIVAGKPKKN